MKPKITKDLPPKSPAKVKGGTPRFNDNITLVRAAKPKVTGKDLPPKVAGQIKGGTPRMNDNITLVRAAKPKVKKDLTPRSPAKIKGGKTWLPSNF